jgi:HEAT repeat protein
VRMHGAEALWSIQREAEPLIPMLLAEFASEDRQIRIRAYRLLLSMGEQAKTAVAPLRKLADDPRPHVRQAARKALEGLAHD